MSPIAQSQPSLSPADVQAIAAQLAHLAKLQTPAQAVEMPYDCTFEAYCTDRLLDVRRPYARPLSASTAKNVCRYLRQMGFLDAENRPARAPDWTWFKEFVRHHPKGAQSLDHHRKALVWYSGYYRTPVPDDPWARRRLDDRKSVEIARREGRVKERCRFFQIPHLQKLVAKQNGSFHHPLNEATHRVICYTSVYLGPRGTELFHLRNKDFIQTLGLVDVWAGKQGKRRRVQPPEPYALMSKLDPTLLWYHDNVRPTLSKGRFDGPDDPFFLHMDEKSWDVEVHEVVLPGASRATRHGWPSERAYGQFVETGLRRVLPDARDRPGPHGFRRACATLRVRNGWTIPQVATFIGDTPSVIERSYVDWEWLGSPKVGILAPKRLRPWTARLRPDRFGDSGAPTGDDAMVLPVFREEPSVRVVDS